MIYLDSAATSLQKPNTVPRASSYAMTHLASPGRGGHKPAQEAANLIFSCREELGLLFSEPNPENIVFTSSATHSLNIAIKTLVKPGSTVLISGWEHNAVTRPLRAIENVNIKIASAPLFNSEATLRAFSNALTCDIDAVIFTHVSNVFGFVLPIEKISTLCRNRHIPFIIDASQSAGALPINQSQLKATFIAMPGHKSLLGPQGTGVLLCNSNHITPLIEGGTGSASRCKKMPENLPDRLEAGTHNICGIAGLRAGVRYIRRRGLNSIAHHEKTLLQRMGKALSPYVKTFLAEDSNNQSAVLSFQVKNWDCEEFAFALAQRNTAVRAGLHCAPLAHQTACTLEEGTVRASISPFTTVQEVDFFVRQVRQLASQKAYTTHPTQSNQLPPSSCRKNR